jgi:signal transduction histidine kinase
MLRFLGSLKTRTAVATSLVIAAILLAHGFYLVVRERWELRRDIEARAALFAELTCEPISLGYDNYYASGLHRFRALVREHLRREPSVDRVRIISVKGRVLYDSSEAESDGPRSEDESPALQDAAVLEATLGLEPQRVPVRDRAGQPTLEIVVPYVEEWGRHRLAVAYRVDYSRLGPAVQSLVWATAGLTLVSIVAAAFVAVAFTRHITQPIEELTRGAQSIAEGRFDQRLDIWSGDEIQLLAEAFNHMAARLKENVEQLERSNRKLAEVNEELKELDRLKSDLLANVSHELRTPLTAIKGYTDYMLERKLGAVTEKQEKGLTVVQRNLERLSKSISALLDFSRMDVGHVALNIQPFALPGLVDQVVTGLRAELERKRLTFTGVLDPALPPVIGDRERLSQVFENLIINAMKFTPDGGEISVTATRAGRISRPTAEIRVRDTGIGIPANQLDKIFQRFHQVDGSSTRRYGGVGLGLSIVKIILDAHGAPIGVQSLVGRGTEFRFELPVVDLDKSAPRDERTREAGESGAGVAAGGEAPRAG